MINWKCDQLYEEHGLCTERCAKCIYCSNPKSKSAKACDFIGVKGYRRPCPAGDNCTEFVKTDKRKKPSKLMNFTI